MIDNIDLFDRFIFGQLTPTGREDFRQRLKEDERLALDFRIYSCIVREIRRRGRRRRI